MVMTVEMLEKVEIPPMTAMAPAKFPPPIFADSFSVLVFLCFRGDLLQDA
jgi:hypothetical protein